MLRRLASFPSGKFLAFPLLFLVLGIAGRLTTTSDPGSAPIGPLPSTTAVPLAEAERGLPLMSMWIDPYDLDDPVNGILANPEARGRTWERPAFISYFDDGRLQFETSLGVRVHGGATRRQAVMQSYRLYFRDELGADRFGPGVLFNGQADPLRRLVLHNDRRRAQRGQHRVRDWHLSNPLAYTIAERLGAIVPRTMPVRFFLNGEWQDVYVVSEHFGVKVENNPDFFSTRFDDRVYGPYDPRANVTSRELLPMEELHTWVRGLGRPLTMRQLDERIDTENLTRWFLSVLFCGTTDAFQLPSPFYNASRTDRNWFWINWDMDQSFWQWNLDSFFNLLESTRPGGGRGARPRSDHDVRAVVISALLADDAEYRAYFMRAFEQMLNQRLTPQYLDAQFRAYAQVARTYGISNLDYLQPLRRFLTKRSDFLWQSASAYLGTGEAVRCKVVPPPGGLFVDGVHITEPFEGRYFLGTVLNVAMPDATARPLSHWVVNGERVDGNNGRLRFQIESDLMVEVQPI